MKRKIGHLYGVPIVEGNPNELNKNEIHVKSLEGFSVSEEELITRPEDMIDVVVVGKGEQEEWLAAHPESESITDPVELIKLLLPDFKAEIHRDEQGRMYVNRPTKGDVSNYTVCVIPKTTEGSIYYTIEDTETMQVMDNILMRICTFHSTSNDEYNLATIIPPYLPGDILINIVDQPVEDPFLLLLPYTLYVNNRMNI